MKPYLVEYLRSRDLEHYDRLLRQLTSATGANEWTVRTTIQAFMRQLVQQYPSLTEEEMIRMARERASTL